MTTVNTPVLTSWSPDSVNNLDYGVTDSDVLTLNGTADANVTISVFDNGLNIGTAVTNSSGVWTFTTPVISNGINAFTELATNAAGNVSAPQGFPMHVVVDTSTPSVTPLVGGAKIGVMMDGAEASWVGFPAASDLDNLKSHGVDLVRLPIAWELMQNTLNGSLSATYLAGLKSFLSEAAARGMQVIVELHNFGGYDTNWQSQAAANWGNFSSYNDPSVGQPVGSAAVPTSSFVNLWTQLATALSGQAGVAGYDLMNEPAVMSNTTWQTAAQQAVNAIRTVDTHTAIYVEGSSWSAASTWPLPWYSGNLNIVDPSNKIVYEAHQYFDANSSGTYSQPFNSQTDYTNLGADLLQPFLSWLKANNAQGMIGEFGAPVTDPQWLPMLNAFLNTLQANGMAATYCNYMYASLTDPSWVPPSGGLSIDPAIGQGAATMELIFEHTAPSIAGYVPTNGTGSSGTTTANILKLTGTGASYSKVNVYDNGTLIGTATSDITGAWSFTTGTLTNGVQNFTATNIDAAGNSSESSFTLAVTVATAGPSAPAITSFSPDKGVVGDGITNATTLTLTGTAAANSTVTVFDGTTKLGTAAANASGAWSYTTGTLSNAAHSFTATDTDALGNISAASTALAVTVDTVAPSAPAITSFSPDSGTVGDGITSATTLTLTGTAAANSTVNVFDGTSKLGTAAVNASGTWSYTIGTLSNAAHSFTATDTDALGNISAASTALAVTVDTVAPAVSSLVASGSGITNGTGDLNAGHVVTLTVNLSEAVTVAGGTPTLTLNDGGTATYTGGSGGNALTFSYTVAAGQNTSDLAVTAVNLNSATVTDAAGNAANLTGAVTNPAGTLQIDTTTPAVSSVVASGSGITTGSGDLNAGHVVTLTVKLSEAVTVAGGTPTLALNDAGMATYTGGSGSNALTFSYTVAAGQNTADLAVTAVNLNAATVMDAAGNTANLTGAVTNPAGTLQIDTTASAAPVISSDAPATGTAVNAVTLIGTAEANSLVTVYEGTTVLGTATTNSAGAWSYTTGTLAAGSYTFTATATDAAGNVSAMSQPIDPTISSNTYPTNNTNLAITDTNDTVILSGSNDTAYLTGSGNTIQLSGSNDSLIITGSGNSIHVTGSNDSVSATGVDTVTFSGSGTVAATIGSGSTLNLADSLTGSGNDTLALTGNGGTINLNQLAHFSGFSGVSLSGSSDTLTLTNANLTVTRLSGSGDTIKLGTGIDTIAYTNVNQSTHNNHDTIIGFNTKQDKIDFSAISGLNSNAQHVTINFLTSTPGSIAGHTIDVVTSRGSTIVYADATGLSESVTANHEDMQINLTGVVAMNYSDFILHH